MTTLYQQSIAAVSAEGYILTEIADDGNVTYVEGISLDSYDSTIVGNSAGTSATGSYNTIVGYEAAQAAETSESLMAIGYQTAAAAATAGTSVIIGNRAAYSWTSGTQLVCLGHNAAQSAESASYTVAVGCSALYGASSHLYTAAVGDAAGFAAEGSRLSMLGSRAGMYASGDDSVYVGNNAGYFATGNENVFVGADASGLAVSWTGSRSVAVGARAAAATVVASDAVALGADAVVADRAVAVGADAGAGEGSLVIGAAVSATGSNCVVLLPSAGASRVIEGDDVVNIADLLMSSGTNESREAVIDAATTLFTGTLEASSLDAAELTTSGAVTLSNVTADGTTFWRMKAQQYNEQNLLVFQSSGGAQCQFTDKFEPSVLNFTGSHRCRFAGADGDEPAPGSLVSATGEYSEALGVDEAVPAVRLCSRARDPTAFGVAAGFEGPSRDFCLGTLRFPVKRDPGDERLIVQSDGEGVILVCDQNGPVLAGDLLCSSDVPGAAMRQGDDVVRSYTVAKATADCFAGAPLPRLRDMEQPGRAGDYARAIIGCVYKF